VTSSTATEEATAAKLTIDVWADVVCPWCYLGEKRLDDAIARSEHAAEIDLRIHSFQLDPNASTEVIPTLESVAAKYGIPVDEARATEEQLAADARSEGLRFEVDRPLSSTFDMLRLVHLGAEHGVAWEYMRALQAEVFGGNFGAFKPETLIRVGTELGIPAAEIKNVLAGDRYADAVLADSREAVELGARGVPFTVLGERFGIPGAISTEQYGLAIDEVWERVNG
jgi:predicted DsbA family dithiol-disulfide isomerase